MTDIEKRLVNTETALVALWSLLEDTFPPAYADSVATMMEEYFDANKSLGSVFRDKAPIFHSKD